MKKKDLIYKTGISPTTISKMVRGEAVSSSVIGKICFEENAWKELFSLQKEDEHNTSDLFADSYKIIGFPFFNQENRMAEFEDALDTVDLGLIDYSLIIVKYLTRRKNRVDVKQR